MMRALVILASVVLVAESIAFDAVDPKQPFFPVFHIRPPSGHVNDPNGPFRDPQTGFVHLFMQYCPRGPCMGQKAPGNRTRNYQSATHFVSKDGGATWTWTGNASGVVASCDPLIMPGTPCPGIEAKDDCPDDLGVYSGSTTLVDGVPYYAYPGVHLYNYEGDPNAVTMSQCFATPTDRTDPLLRHWKKQTFIPQSKIPHGISQHFHDDSEMFQVEGSSRWWIFMGSAACGGSKATGDCPYPDPEVKSHRGHGVNYLFSTDGPSVEGEWQAEHSLVNTSSFVSCPEFFRLPNMAKNQYIYHAMGAPNQFGTFEPESMTFHPDSTSVGRYDWGDGHASKSYWDSQTQRRIMWSWIAGSFPCSNSQGFECDSMQSVPRIIEFDPSLETLIINPIAELTQLRTGLLVHTAFASLPRTPTAVHGANGATLDMTINFVCGGSESCAAAVQVRGGSENASTGLWMSFDCDTGRGCTYQVGKSKKVTVPFSGDVPWRPADGFQFRVLVDTCVVEVYAFNGRSVFTQMFVPPSPADTTVRLVSSMGRVGASISVYGMGSAYAADERDIYV